MTRWIRTVILASWALCSGSVRAEGSPCNEILLQRARPMMSTTVTVTVSGCSEAALEARVRESFAEMDRLAGMLSEWDPHSPVSLVNAKAGLEPVHIPRELLEVLQKAQTVSVLTSGAFDASWAALGDLWRFDRAPPRLPLVDEVNRRRALVGYRDLVLDLAEGTAFLKRPGMRLGLGGIAKGYIAAAAADLLVARGVSNVLVAASGDIAARGRNGTRPWTVAIQNPRNPASVLAIAELHDESISTSGDYERFFIIEGQRYHHVLDPRTGYPATGSEGVTVIAPDGATADALATGLFVLGAERSPQVLAALSRVSALHVGANGTVCVSGTAQRFNLDRLPVGLGRRRSCRHSGRMTFNGSEKCVDTERLGHAGCGIDLLEGQMR